MFNFYDENKPESENDKNSKKARHNKDILQLATAGVALATAIATAALTGKKLYDTFR